MRPNPANRNIENDPDKLVAERTGLESSDLWRDVFVEQPLPWNRFMLSVGLHSTALALIWIVSASWVRQQKILEHAPFERSSVIAYTPQEYLPPLDTGATKSTKTERGDPAYAKQPILSVPKEANSRAQTVVAPPNLALDKDVPMPNIVATGAILPAVPMDATRASPRMIAPDTEVIAPAPDVQIARARIVDAAMKSDIIAPPPEVLPQNNRGMARPEATVVSPPPDVTRSTRGRSGTLDIAQSAVVAPSPQLALDEQHQVARRGAGLLSGGSVQPVAPAPTVTVSGSATSGGRLVALGIHPVAASGPVVMPAGNRRGAFEASPQGRVGASGTPQSTASNQGSTSGKRGDFSSLPSGLHVGAPDRTGTGKEGSEVASASKLGAPKGARSVSEISDDKITDEDRKVFGGKRPYEMTLNMPNLNSSTGSWEIRFAEVGAGGKAGDLLAPVATEKSDPGYPLELIRSNVHGTVTLYAVIGADGNVARIRVLNSPDDRLDSFAAEALSRCKFAPAERGGKPVALEAVVRIPFKVHRSF